MSAAASSPTCAPFITACRLSFFSVMLRITLRGIEISPEATVFAVRASRISLPPSVSFASASSASEADRAAAAAPSLTTGGRGDGHGILLVGHVDGERRQDARLKADGAGDIGSRQLAERAAAEEAGADSRGLLAGLQGIGQGDLRLAAEARGGKAPQVAVTL